MSGPPASRRSVSSSRAGVSRVWMSATFPARYLTLLLWTGPMKCQRGDGAAGSCSAVPACPAAPGRSSRRSRPAPQASAAATSSAGLVLLTATSRTDPAARPAARSARARRSRTRARFSAISCCAGHAPTPNPGRGQPGKRPQRAQVGDHLGQREPHHVGDRAPHLAGEQGRDPLDGVTARPCPAIRPMRRRRRSRRLPSSRNFTTVLTVRSAAARRPLDPVGGEHLVAPAGQRGQHRRRLGGVGRLAQDAALEHDDGVGGQHRQPRRPRPPAAPGPGRTSRRPSAGRSPAAVRPAGASRRCRRGQSAAAGRRARAARPAGARRRPARDRGGRIRPRDRSRRGF